VTIEMANAGFSNTLCTSSKLLSLKRCIQWENLWHGDPPTPPPASVAAVSTSVASPATPAHGEGEEEEEEHDYTFVDSFKCLIDHLKQNLQIELNSPVRSVDYTLPPAVATDASTVTVPHSHVPELIKLTTTTGVTYYAKTVVITSSPHVLKSSFSSSPSAPSAPSVSAAPLMEFHPPLSEEIQAALETTTMNSIVKVILKFSARPWPQHLHGMIMANATPNHRFLLPEMWFRDVDQTTVSDHPEESAVCYVIGFTTTEYAQKILNQSQGEALTGVLDQMDQIFSYLEPHHMTGEQSDVVTTLSPKALPKPSEVFLGGTFWHWTPEHHPYIGGGYSSPIVGKATGLCDRLSKPYGEYQNIYFAGEVTSLPGATAHAALESGVRAAEQVARHLKK
jgi:hypothetical protein